MPRAVLACLAVSIAGAGTVLTFAYSLLIQPLPFPEGSRLAVVEPLGLASSERAYLCWRTSTTRSVCTSRL